MKLKTPLRLDGTDTTVCVRDSDGWRLFTMNRALGEDDYTIAREIVNAVNAYILLPARDR